MVGKLEELLPQAEVVVTVTGRFDVIDTPQLRLLKDGAILCNAGHYNMEINVPHLEALASSKETLKEGIEGYTIGKKRLYLLQRANPLNLSSGAGNPIEIMELGYALQLLSLEAILKDPALTDGIQALPEAVNREACRLALEAT